MVTNLSQLMTVTCGGDARVETRSHQIMLKVADARAVVEAALARGAILADPLRDWEYGERQAAVTDPFGHQWVLNETLVDVAPEEWGGQTVAPRSPAP